MMWRIFRLELRVAFRHSAEIANPLWFFLIVITLFPLSIGPEPQLLARIAPGIIWVAALLASLLALERLFRDDLQDGSLEQLAGDVRALIVTRGGEGSEIYADGRRYIIPCVGAEQILDPTGCGDAYRSGLLYGIANGYDWEKTGRLAAVMGAIKIASRGGQNHQPSREEIGERYRGAFGALPW